VTTHLKQRSAAARTRTLVVAGMAAVALAVAGCGGASGGDATAGYGAPSPAAGGSGAASVALANSNLGKILVDGKGRTLYLFQKDKTAKSTCSGACAENWPPLLTSGKARAAGSARQDLIGTITRADGTIQVTYNDHPLYRFVNDKKAGDTKGQAVRAFGAKWYALTRGGRKIGGY
jgi:predicted lipoprotein with Yx(FWY)xxD motif